MVQSATMSCRASNPMDSSASHFSKLEQGRFTRSDGQCERLTTSKDYVFDCNSQISWSRCSRRSAEPVILLYTRTKTALTTGLIDAAENNWPSYVASDHYSVAPYFALTEHTMTPDVLIMSMKTWGSLDPADQNIFRNAARDNIFARPMEKSGGDFPQASTGLRRDCHRNRPEAATGRNDGSLYESSDGFALKTSCRVHPKRPVKFPPLVRPPPPARECHGCGRC